MALSGELIIGGARVATSDTFRATNPATTEEMEPAFSVARPEDIELACALASAAFDTYRETPPETRAAFLESVADNIEALGDELIERAHAESGLPIARLQGERGRTAGQLRLFAKTVRDGEWMGLRIDPAMPDRTPLPRPDLRQRKIALGPVAVFGASNFPLAFSVAGGDTASALAAGCPVVVKGHPAHPGTGELVGTAIAAAVKEAGLPEGVFSLVNGGTEVGAALVENPHIKAVGFTGSRAGGQAVMAAAQARPEPIPVFAEMSSVNPVLLMPSALEARAGEIAKGFAGSLVMGAGQFCTNPGLLLAIEGTALDRFKGAVTEAFEDAPADTMLTSNICEAYRSGVETLVQHADVTEIARGPAGEGPNRCQAALFETSASAFLADDSLSHEVFGAASLVVACKDLQEMTAVLEHLEGQLTVTLQIDEADHDTTGSLLPILERKAGRILVNGWPTGVEVAPAMVHGGPYPSTSDSRTTSVGTLAIERFLRPVCYQAFPEGLLPKPVADGNPYGAPRLMDGEPES